MASETDKDPRTQGNESPSVVENGENPPKPDPARGDEDFEPKPKPKP